jgi:hypothetical protein
MYKLVFRAHNCTVSCPNTTTIYFPAEKNHVGQSIWSRGVTNFPMPLPPYIKLSRKKRLIDTPAIWCVLPLLQVLPHYAQLTENWQVWEPHLSTATYWPQLRLCRCREPPNSAPHKACGCPPWVKLKSPQRYIPSESSLAFLSLRRTSWPVCLLG